MNASQWLGPYELQQCIEYTQQGEVWKAFDTEQRYYVCLYISRVSPQIASSKIAQFFDKMQQVAVLRHPNIMQVLDLCTVQMSTNATEQGVLVVTEYAEYQPLTGYIEAVTSAGRLPTPQEIVHLLTPICSALDYVHQQGLVHGAIRPDSILLSGPPTTPDVPGMPRLINFYTHYVQPPLTLPLNASFYVAPEQVQGDLDNPRSDIYALGILLYELCTGTRPFQGDNPADILMQHTSMTPPSPALIQPHLLPALTAVIVRCLSKDPSARFPTASAVVSAMAKALNMPAHDSGSQPGIQGAEDHHQHDPTVNSPTFLSPQVPSAQPAMAALAPDHASPLPSQSPQFTPTVTPLSRSLSDVSTIRQPLLATTPPVQKKQRRPPRRYIIAATLVILALVISALGYLVIRPNLVAQAAPIVGHAFFTNSGKYTPNSAQGIADTLQIAMNNIPAPQTGKSYYFWLLADTDTAGVNFPPILLGSSKMGGNVKIPFADSSSRDLLASYSRFLVTEESSAMTPVSPSLDMTAWRYFAQFSRTKNLQTGFSLLDHLRHLLAADPKLQHAGLNGGLDIWLYRNALNVMVLASSARDAQRTGNDPAFLRRQLVRILDYLDGSQYIHTENLPPGLDPVEIDPTIAHVALLEFDQLNQSPPGYVDHIGTHLREIVDSPDATPEQKQLAIQISNGLNNAQRWLEMVHTDAQQLMKMSDTQLQQPAAQSLFDNLYTQADHAFTGQFDPNTGQVQDGVIQIHAQDLQLATFDIQPYSASK